MRDTQELIDHYEASLLNHDPPLDEETIEITSETISYLYAYRQVHVALKTLADMMPLPDMPWTYPWTIEDSWP
ncbi:hypothetical protein ES708_33583 [subsurface metagenome]